MLEQRSPYPHDSPGTGLGFRMLWIDQPPEHVRVQVQAGKIKEKHASLKLWKLCIKNAPMLCKHRARLLQKLLVIEHAGGTVKVDLAEDKLVFDYGDVTAEAPDAPAQQS